MAVEGGGRGATGNDTRRATKEWDPWLVPCIASDNSPYPRKCAFCGWSKVFVRKRAFLHFGYGGVATSDRCKKMPRNVREKFLNCRGVVPRSMSYEQMYDAPDIEGAADDVAESLVERVVDVEVEGSTNPSSGTNELQTPNPDSVDST